MDELLKDLMESNFISSIIEHRIKNDIYAIRSALDRFHMLDRKYNGLTKAQQEDMDELWKDMEGLTRAYVYYSGDYDLDELDEWE